jgi:hypothetical protein
VNCCPAIVTVPALVVPVDAATLSVTAPFPLPLAPALTVIHDTLLAAVQAQPAPAVTLTVVVPPPASTVADAGVMAKAQPASWVTVTCWPAIVTAPVRGPLVAGGTPRDTTPLPLPLVGPLNTIHGAPLAALQAQPAAVVTVVVALPPAAPMVWVSGDTS